MKVLFDTNVILDVLLAREPFVAASARLVGCVETGALEGLLGATTVTTIHYLVSRELGAAWARRLVNKLLGLFDVAAVDSKVLASATTLKLADFEDAVLHEAGRLAGAEIIATRDVAGFKRGSLPACSPLELLVALEAEEEG